MRIGQLGDSSYVGVRRTGGLKLKEEYWRMGRGRVEDWRMRSVEDWMAGTSGVGGRLTWTLDGTKRLGYFGVAWCIRNEIWEMERCRC